MIKDLLSRKNAISSLLIATVSGLLSGASTAALIVLIHQSIKTELPDYAATLIRFFMFLLGYCVCNILSTYYINRLSQQILHDLRLLLCRRILATPLKTLEELGKATILSRLSQAFLNISGLVGDLPGILAHVAKLVGLYAYMFWLSPLLFSIILLALCLGVPLYVRPMGVYRKYLRHTAQMEDALNEYLHALTEGVKELLQHQAKKQSFVNVHLRSASDRVRTSTLRTRLLNAVLMRWGELYLFLGLAFILFVLPQRNLIDFEEIAGFLLIFLFTLPSMGSLIGFIFSLQRMRVSLQHIDALGERLGSNVASDGHRDAFPANGQAGDVCLTLENVAYTYHHSERDEDFTLGPISCAIDTAQIVFVTGGNGSGKSTLAKILCGLYIPESGQITYNNMVIKEQNREAYRELFSVIFFDFFLFETLLGLEDQNIDEKANGYLKRLHLAHKVSIKNGRYSLLNLSQGQRKRLALLRAYLDERPIYLFDEWAADQDPAFKAVFYEQLLPDLKQEGKTVIVITHDDSYFHVADRIIKLVDGRQVEAL